MEIEENSELDLLVSYKAHAGDARIPAVCEDMKQEMGEGKYYADMLERMAQFELTLLDWAEGPQGRAQIRCVCRQMLAGLPGAVRLRAVLCQLPPGLPRHSRRL